jgi:hypothetical protein
MDKLYSKNPFVGQNSFSTYSRTPLIRLIGTVSHPDMQKIWITGFFFANR